NLVRVSSGLFPRTSPGCERQPDVQSRYYSTLRILRDVVNDLANGASRDDLRVYEEWVQSVLAYISPFKSIYESSRLCKLKYRVSEFIFKMEEIDAVCEK
ncbi:hypothetical protein PENTCL1PPCAC_10062, partial [Pristionchus entomophagus]